MGKRHVSVVGMGAMGRALAEALLVAGHSVTVWNRTAAKTVPLAEQGAVAVETVAEAVAAAEVIVVCVLDYPAVRELLEPVAGKLAGRILVNVTNGTPDEARSTARWVREAGADYLDGGIMAVPVMIGQPEAVVLYSGEQRVFDSCAELLGHWGAAKFVGEDTGLASLHDLALLGAMYGMFAGFNTAVAMVRTEGVTAATFVNGQLVPWLSAMIGVLPMLAEEIDSGAEVSAERKLVERVALTNIVETAVAQGVAARVVAPMRAIRDNA